MDVSFAWVSGFSLPSAENGAPLTTALMRGATWMSARYSMLLKKGIERSRRRTVWSVGFVAASSRKSTEPLVSSILLMEN